MELPPLFRSTTAGGVFQAFAGSFGTAKKSMSDNYYYRTFYLM